MPPRFTHAESYLRRGPAGWVHRDRLACLRRIVARLPLAPRGRMADFGCSDGFILEQLRRHAPVLRTWELTGFDRSSDLLALARRRRLPRTSLRQFDLNDRTGPPEGGFDLVICLETLEHVGDCAAALDNLHAACRPGGTILLSVPVEVGLPGVVKFFGRSLLRRSAYGDFFRGRSRWAYAARLLVGARIDGFRQPPQPGWGPHLGFDTRVFENRLRARLVRQRGAELLRRQATRTGSNLIFVLRRSAAAPQVQRAA